MKKTAFVLLVVGLLQMSGDALDGAGLTRVGSALKALGAATTASPAPRVFAASRGLETFSTRFYVEWTDDVNESHSLLITPELYARIRGPYNRRNMYGAALAYGPILASTDTTRRLFDSVAEYALCGQAPLLQELRVNTKTIRGRVRVRYEPLAGGGLGDLPRVIEAPCP
jgi:hypothetical protein